MVVCSAFLAFSGDIMVAGSFREMLSFFCDFCCDEKVEPADRSFIILVRVPGPGYFSAFYLDGAFDQRGE